MPARLADSLVPVSLHAMQRAACLPYVRDTSATLTNTERAQFASELAALGCTVTLTRRTP